MVFSEFLVYICHDLWFIQRFFLNKRWLFQWFIISNSRGLLFWWSSTYRGDGKVSIYHPLTRRPGNKVSQGAGSPMSNMPLWRVTHFPDHGKAGEKCSKYHDHTVDGNAASPGMYKTLENNGIQYTNLNWCRISSINSIMIIGWSCDREIEYCDDSVLLRFFNPDILEPVFTHKWQSNIWYSTVYKTTSWTRWDAAKTVQRMGYSPEIANNKAQMFPADCQNQATSM